MELKTLGEINREREIERARELARIREKRSKKRLKEPLSTEGKALKSRQMQEARKEKILKRKAKKKDRVASVKHKNVYTKLDKKLKILRMCVGGEWMSVTLDGDTRIALVKAGYEKLGLSFKGSNKPASLNACAASLLDRMMPDWRVDHKKQIKARPPKKHQIDVTTREFLETYEWRKVRYEALKLFDRKCMCCGRMPPDVQIHVDHIKPRRIYPDLALEITNLQLLCHECNHGKGNWDETDWRDA